MKMKDVIRFLVDAEDYFLARLTVDDSVIEVIRDHMGSHYNLIKEKEEQFQEKKLRLRKVVKLFSDAGIQGSRAGVSLKEMLIQLDKISKDADKN